MYVSSVTTVYGPGINVLFTAEEKIYLFSTEPIQPIMLLEEH
jgi:hypothetical protein